MEIGGSLKRLVTSLARVAAGAYPGICSMKQLGVLLLLLDGMLVQVTPQHFVGFP